MTGRGPGDPIARRLTGQAAGRLHDRRPDWVRAMAAETDAVSAPLARLRWAAGCIQASHRMQGGSWFYPLALALGLCALIWQQWSADEGLLTALMLGLASLALGLLDRRRVIASGLALGSVVAAVHVFGALTGVRPPYETHDRGVLHGLLWVVLTAPALLTAWAGARLSARLDP